MRYKESVIFQKGGTANHSPFTSKNASEGLFAVNHYDWREATE